jgi:hypothetical protein
VFFYSRDRTGEHPDRHLTGYAGILQADAYAGFLRLYAPDRQPGPITEASCWAHGRRKFFELADVAAKARGQLPMLAPLAVKRIDAIFDIEREINGRSIEDRLAARRERVAPLVMDLEAWMRAQRAKLSRHHDVGKAMDYMLKRWATFTRFLEDDGARRIGGVRARTDHRPYWRGPKSCTGSWRKFGRPPALTPHQRQEAS